MFLFYIGIAILFAILSLKIIFKTSSPGFDHFAHLSMIQDIKTNKHRFILNRSNIIDDFNFAYPIFFHWLCSFIPMKILKFNYLKFNFLIELLLYSVIFIVLLISNCDYSVEKYSIIFLVIVTNPFGRFLWNARARGISARNFGLILGYLYYLVYHFDIFRNNFVIQVICLVFISVLILISSQFVTQFLAIFSTYRLLNFDFIPIVCFIFGILIFAIFFHKNFKNYIIGQWEHKQNWYNHISKIELLKFRKSVYRDLFYDFYKKKSIKYILTNPIVESILGFPILIGILLVKPQAIFNDTFLVASIISFLLTSFKSTRAFGEPQRYIDFALPGLLIFGLEYLNEYQLLSIALVNIMIFVLHINLFTDFYSTHIDPNQIIEAVNSLKLNSQEEKNNILISNSWAKAGFFLPEKKFRLLIPSFYNVKQYGFSIKQMFPESLYFFDKLIVVEWLKTYEPNWFLLDTFDWKENHFEEILESLNISFKKDNNCKDLIVYNLSYGE